MNVVCYSILVGLFLVSTSFYVFMPKSENDRRSFLKIVNVIVNYSVCTSLGTI